MDAHKGPQAVVRDEAGFVVPPELWTDERSQRRNAITEQFREGEQLPTLAEVREEMAARWAWVDDWDHERAFKEWTLRQIDGLLLRNAPEASGLAAGI